MPTARRWASRRCRHPGSAGYLSRSAGRNVQVHAVARGCARRDNIRGVGQPRPDRHSTAVPRPVSAVRRHMNRQTGPPLPGVLLPEASYDSRSCRKAPGSSDQPDSRNKGSASGPHGPDATHRALSACRTGSPAVCGLRGCILLQQGAERGRGKSWLSPAGERPQRGCWSSEVSSGRIARSTTLGGEPPDPSKRVLDPPVVRRPCQQVQRAVFKRAHVEAACGGGWRREALASPGMPPSPRTKGLHTGADGI